MRHYLLMLALLITMSFTATAQFNYLWSTDYQHTSSAGYRNQSKKMVKDSNGNIYVLSDVTSDKDPSGVVTGLTYHYTVLSKFTNGGTLLQSRNINVNNHLSSGFNLIGAFGLQIDDNNDLYIGYNNYNTITDYNANIAKYNSNLSRQWLYNFNPSGIDEGIDIKLSSAGEVFGLVKSLNGSDVQYHLIKADSAVSSSLPFFSFDMNLDFVNSFLVDNNGEMFVTGYRIIGGVKNALTAGVKNAGTLKWKRTYNGGTIIRDDVGTQIVQGNGNELFVVGHSDRGLPNSNDVMIMKYFRNNGKFDFATFLDNSNGYDIGKFIKVYNFYNLYVASVTGNKVVIDRVGTRTGIHSGRRIYEPLPNTPYNSVELANITGFEVTPFDNILITGNIQATNTSNQTFTTYFCSRFFPATGRVPFDAAFKLDVEVPSPGDFDTSVRSVGFIADYPSNTIFLMTDKYSNYQTHNEEAVRLYAYDLATLARTTSNVDDLISGSKATVTIYPNPVSDEMSLSSKSDISFVEITDVSGRLIYTSELIGRKNITIDLSKIQTGVYILKTTSSNSEINIQKFIKH